MIASESAPMSPLSSATGMKRPGLMMVRSGLIQRAGGNPQIAVGKVDEALAKLDQVQQQTATPADAAACCQLDLQHGRQVVQGIAKGRQPHGVAVVIDAQHGCMTGRGVRTPGVGMVTSRLLGCFLEDQRSRKEVLGLMGY